MDDSLKARDIQQQQQRPAKTRKLSNFIDRIKDDKTYSNWVVYQIMKNLRRKHEQQQYLLADDPPGDSENMAEDAFVSEMFRSYSKSFGLVTCTTVICDTYHTPLYRFKLFCRDTKITAIVKCSYHEKHHGISIKSANFADSDLNPIYNYTRGTL